MTATKIFESGISSVNSRIFVSFRETNVGASRFQLLNLHCRQLNGLG
jgi:hypothetical protein